MKSIKGSYKGLIIDPHVRNYFLHKNELQKSAPFTQTIIEAYKRHGYLKQIPSIQQITRNEFRCNRCYNDKSFIAFECARCNKICYYCRHCINMGRISSCTTLLTWHGPNKRLKKKHRLDWQGQFTDLQQKAAYELQQSLIKNKSHLLHAVCGAGKTEILFPAIHTLLEMGKCVALATPRTDVVLELAPRLQAVLPDTTIHALYGNAPKQRGIPELVITTTHQLYKYQQAFDAIIVDEADAFPYTFDETLQRAVQKAKKPDAPVATVTATPTPSQILQAKQLGGYSFIARRFHGFPLPVPRLDRLYNYNKCIQKGTLPKELQNWTCVQLKNKRPFLIFFHKIELMDKALPLFQSLHPKILSVHAEDPNRKEKVLDLRNEEVPGLLTTTILERGITIKNVQVAVVGAENKIFTDSALIQIAGRAGRNKDYANGDVVFFHHGISADMDSAILQIRQLNEVGFRTTKKREDKPW